MKQAYLRVLQPDEYRQAMMAGEPEPPANSLVVAAFSDAGELMGRVILVTIPHLEGAWVAPAARGTGMFGRLMKFVEREAAGLGCQEVAAFSVSPIISDYLRRLGFSPWGVQVFRKKLEV